MSSLSKRDTSHLLLDRQMASRLMRRCWGWTDLPRRDALVGLDTASAVDRLLAGIEPGSRWGEILPLETRSAEQGQVAAYRTWQLARLIESPEPAREMMTLFWLDVFAVSGLRVAPLRLYHDFRLGLAERAFAPLPEVFRFALSHAAFLLNLRAASNYRTQPQEQIGRFIVGEILGLEPAREPELVRDISRAYTGLFVTAGKLRRYDYEHDPGAKKIGEMSGDLNVEDVAVAVAKHPATARHLTRRLFRWFVASEEPVPEDLHLAAQEPVRDGRPVSEVLKLILGWEACLTDRRYCRVKSPLEVYLAIARPLQCRATNRVAENLVELGWDVIHPPTLAGWPRGRAWLNAVQLARRVSFVQAILSGQDVYGGPPSGDVLLQADWPDRLRDILLENELPPQVAREWDALIQKTPTDDRLKREAVTFLVSLPEFQLT